MPCVKHICADCGYIRFRTTETSDRCPKCDGRVEFEVIDYDLPSDDAINDKMEKLCENSRI
jgi:hypothetical protein